MARHSFSRWLACAALSCAAMGASAQIVEIRDPAEMEVQLRNELQREARGLSWRLGTVRLDPVPAQIKLPAQFRLLHRSMLIRLARLHGVPFDQQSVGWVVHREIDLGREDAWFVQVRYLPQDERIAPPSHLAGEDPSDSYAAYVGRIADRVLPDMPGAARSRQWNPATGVATWRVAAPRNDGTPQQYFAARVLSKGVLLFVVSNLSDIHSELAERSVRLIAARAQEVAPLEQ